MSQERIGEVSLLPDPIQKELMAILPTKLREVADEIERGINLTEYNQDSLE